jgi:hypothetical protein
VLPPATAKTIDTGLFVNLRYSGNAGKAVGFLQALANFYIKIGAKTHLAITQSKILPEGRICSFKRLYHTPNNLHLLL